MKRKILVVDDEDTIRKFLKIHLTKLGYDVLEAADGDQAIEQLKRNRVDLLICDIVMPRKNGWEVIQEVRSRPSLKELPVIVLTAKNEDTDMFKGYELGANYYMTKPFNKSQLIFGVNLIFEKMKGVTQVNP